MQAMAAVMVFPSYASYVQKSRQAGLRYARLAGQKHGSGLVLQGLGKRGGRKRSSVQHDNVCQLECHEQHHPQQFDETGHAHPLLIRCICCLHRAARKPFKAAVETVASLTVSLLDSVALLTVVVVLLPRARIAILTNRPWAVRRANV